MLKIGDFSKLAQVSVKTLRHYGKLGLLQPAWIDRFTGYRYYTVEQLPRLNRILALKDLGFSLEQIQRLLQDDLSAAELRGMMRMKHAELERRLQAEQVRLARVEARLRRIEQEGTMPPHEVVLKTVPTQRVVGIRDVIPGYRELAGLFDELRVFLRQQHVILDAASPRIGIYYDPDYRDQEIDAEAAAALPGPLRETGRVIVHDLPGAETMACAVHQGGYEAMSDVYNTMMAWIETNGYLVTGPNREIYLQGPVTELGGITEVQIPVQMKPVSSFVLHYQEKGEMEPKIVTKPAFTVVGMLYHGRNEKNEIPQMWGEFVPRIGEIKHQLETHESYGVCRDLEPEGVFEYVAGVPVRKVEDVPEGMVSWDVPEGKYAVFTCTLKTIHEAYQYAFQTWLPGSGYQRADGPDFEYYDADFDPDASHPELYIYIPIK